MADDERAAGHLQSTSSRTTTTSVEVPADATVLAHGVGGLAAMTDDVSASEEEREGWVNEPTAEDSSLAAAVDPHVPEEKEVRVAPLSSESPVRPSDTTGLADSDLPTDLSSNAEGSPSPSPPLAKVNASGAHITTGNDAEVPTAVKRRPKTENPLRPKQVHPRKGGAAQGGEATDPNNATVPLSTGKRYTVARRPSPAKGKASPTVAAATTSGKTGAKLQTPTSSPQRGPRKGRTAGASATTVPLDDPRTLAALVSPTKQRRLAQGAPELPVSLKALYLATLCRQEGAPRTTALLELLELLSVSYTRQRRLAAARRAREVEKARCEHLYSAGIEHKAQVVEKRERLLKQQEEEVLAPCTFAPEVSRAARRHPAKGLNEFMEKCVEWERQQADRLAARYAREEELTGAPSEPQIDPTSRAIAERLVREGGPRPALWEPKRSQEPMDEIATGERVPVTSAEERRLRRQLKRLLRDVDDDVAGGSDVGGSSPSSSAQRERRVNTEEYLARVEQDIQRRSEKADRLRKQQEVGDGGQAYAAVTGQPLFQPNAMPTLLRDGRRIPYSELSTKERREFRAFLKENGQELALLCCRDCDVSDEKGEGASASAMGRGERPSLAADVSAALEMAASRRERTMERLRAQVSAEETFKPHLTPRSVKLAKDKTGGVRVFDRPLPAKYDAEAIRRQREEETKRERAQEVKQYRPASEPAVQALTDSMLARTDLWQERREARLKQVAERQEAQRMAECTFTPRRGLAHQLEVEDTANADGAAPASQGGGEALAAALLQRQRRRSSVYTGDELQHMADAAEVRLANEVELLRVQTANIDPSFLSSVLEGGHIRDGMEAGMQDDGSLTRSPRRARAAFPHSSPAMHSATRGGGTDHRRFDAPFRLDPPTLGTTMTPQYLLSHLTRLNAPKLQRHESRSPDRPRASGNTSSMSRVAGASPITEPRSVHQSVSRSPNRRDWQDALDRGGSGGRAPQWHGGKPRHASSLPADTAVISEDDAEDEEDELPYLPDPWAALDAQVDHILRRYQ